MQGRPTEGSCSCGSSTRVMIALCISSAGTLDNGRLVAQSSCAVDGRRVQGLCTLVAIAMVHSDNRLTCAIALTLFATGIALSLLLIAAYSRPFTGEISVRPDLLKQVMTSGATP